MHGVRHLVTMSPAPRPLAEHSLESCLDPGSESGYNHYTVLDWALWAQQQGASQARYEKVPSRLCFLVGSEVGPYVGKT